MAVVTGGSGPATAQTELTAQEIAALTGSEALNLALEMGFANSTAFSTTLNPSGAGQRPPTSEELQEQARGFLTGIPGAPPPKPPKTGTGFAFPPLGVSTSQLTQAASLGTPSLDSPTASPVAAGFPLFERMTRLTLDAAASRRASIDQEISIAQLMVELERASPTRAASLAVALGLPQTQDFSFTRAFGAGTDLPSASGGFFGGQVGGQNVSLPGAFSGQELSFLSSNPGTAGIVQDIADRFGLPDIFQRSQAGLVPTSRNLLQVAA